MAQTVQGIRYNYFLIKSQISGKVVDLTDKLEHIDYTEDILLPYISMQLRVSATVNLVSELQIIGGEIVALDIELGSGNFKFGQVIGTDISEGQDEMYVYKVSDVDAERQKVNFTLHLVTGEYYKDQTTRCARRYGKDGEKPLRISEIVEEILINDLDTGKDLIIDETQNTYSFMGNMRRPFYTIQWLCPKSISQIPDKSGENGEDGTINGEANETGGYLFFENKAGYNYRSIDNLVSLSRDSSNDVHGPYEYRGMGAISSNKLEANFQIANFCIEKNTDIRKALITGMYANQTAYFNVLTHKMSYYNYNLIDEIDISTQLGDDAIDKIPIIGDQTSRYMFRISDHGVTGQGEDGLEPSGGANAERTDIAKSVARYNLLFTQSLNMSLPLNKNIKTGDILICKFPRLNQGTAREEDNKLSGKYLVRSVKHHIKPLSSFSYVKLIRDSYGI